MRAAEKDSTEPEKLLKDAKPAILSKDYECAQELAKVSINVSMELLGEEVEDDETAPPLAIDSARDEKSAKDFTDIISRINMAKEKLSKSIKKTKDEELENNRRVYCQQNSPQRAYRLQTPLSHF